MSPAQGATGVACRLAGWRTVHCVADGPEIRHSQGPVLSRSPCTPILRLRLLFCFLPSPVPVHVSMCACGVVAVTWSLLAEATHLSCSCYLERYLGTPDPSLSRTLGPAHLFLAHPCPCLPTGTGSKVGRENTQVAHARTHTTPTRILSLLLLQHSRTLRVSALLPFCNCNCFRTRRGQTDKKNKQQDTRIRYDPSSRSSPFPGKDIEAPLCVYCRHRSQ